MSSVTVPYKRDHAAEEKANAEIAKDCAAIGIKIDSPWDFVGDKNGDLWNYGVAAIFARHIEKSHPPIVIEGLMFAGSWLETKDLFLDPVLAILRRDGQNFLGQAAANALLKMMEPGDEELMKSLILDKPIGESRALLIAGYAKLAKKDAIGPLRTLIHDDDVRNEVLKALPKLGDQTVRDELIAMTKHGDSYVRKIGRDGLVRLEKSIQKASNSKLN
jgi:HEAT repeat protein